MTNIVERVIAFIAEVDPLGDRFSAHDISQLDALQADNKQLREALEAMLFQHGKPHRGEWMNELAFEQAKKVDAQARAAVSAGNREGQT